MVRHLKKSDELAEALKKVTRHLPHMPQPSYIVSLTISNVHN